MKSMVNSGVDDFRKLGIIITQEQLSTLAYINDKIIIDTKREALMSPVYYMLVLLRILNFLPAEMICEPENKRGIEYNIHSEYFD